MRMAGGRGKALGAVLTVLLAMSPVDAIVQDLVFRHVVSHEVRLLANGFTLLGTTWAAAGLLAGLGLLARRTRDAALWGAVVGGLVALAVSGLGSVVVKDLTCRARPGMTEGWGVGPTRPDPTASGLQGFFHFPCLGETRYHGFPSGHATTAFAVAASLVPVAGVRGRRAWLGAAAGVGVSRVVLNAHFLSDVMAGAVLGWWAADVAGPLVGWLRRRWPGLGAEGWGRAE